MRRLDSGLPSDNKGENIAQNIAELETAASARMGPPFCYSASSFGRVGKYNRLPIDGEATIVNLTTLGYGDIILPTDWRLLSGVCAANGLLLFGLCAAFLYELFVRLNKAQTKNRPDC